MTTSNAGKAGEIEASFVIQHYLLPRPSHAYLSASAEIAFYPHIVNTRIGFTTA